MSLYKNGEIWYYDFVVKGKRYCGSTGQRQKSLAKKMHDEFRAQRLADQSLLQVWEQTRRNLGMSATGIPLDICHVWKHFRSHTLSQASEKRMKNYRHYMEEFCAWIATRDRELLAQDVTKETAQEYAVHLKNSPGAPATKNEALASIRMLWDTFSIREGVMENVWRGIPKFKGEAVARDVFSPDELELIGKHATGWVRDLCLTALSTGLREGDICNLRWNCISPDCKWLHIKAVRKTGKPVDIPITRPLREHLLGTPHDGEYVFPVLQEMYAKRPADIGTGIKKFFAEIGIDDVHTEREGYCRRLSTKDVHSLRHTFVYIAACNNVPLPVVQAVVGHSSPTMTRLYMDHASMRDKERYLELMPSYMDGKSDKKESGNDPSPAIQEIIRMVEGDSPKDEILDALRGML